MVAAGFENPSLLVTAALALLPLYFLVKRNTNFERILSVSRALIIVLISVAIAVPYIHAEESLMKQPEIVVLKDESTSASLLEEADLEFEGVEVRERVIASGNSSDLRDGLLRNLEPDTAYLAVSDFQSSTSLEGVATRFDAANSTINALKPEVDEEASVSIEGPSTTVPGAQNRFRIEVSTTDDIPEPAVYLDGSEAAVQRQDNDTWILEKRFSSEGSHTIRAVIDSEDSFTRNDEYFHAVDVTEKPEILVIGNRGSLGPELEEFYEVDYENTVPPDLEDYYTVILKKDINSQELTSFVVEGNGLVYTADPEEDSMDVLPVKKVDEGEETKGAKIVLVIDISKSTGESGASEKIKQVSYNLVEKLPFNNRVGAVAYNRDAFIVSEPKPLANNRGSLKQKISRLKPDGNSFHHNGLKGGKEMLNGTGNIIMVTDGVITAFGRNVNTEQKTRDIASGLDVKLITVGVGSNRNTGFLQDIARRGNGYYLDAEDSGRLQFRFGAGGAEGETVPLTVVNPNHFITENLKVSSSATKFDSVQPRQGADLLVTGTNGKPFLTTWHYGLGRVAAFTGGGTDLSEPMRRDPLLVSRTVSWTIGDPKRKQDKWIRVDSAREPDSVEVRASYRIPGFQRQGEDLYTTELDPGEPGFHSVNGTVYGYNYNPEIEEVGYWSDMEDFARDTGGEVYEPDEREQIKNDIRQFSNRKTVTKKPVSRYFLLAALILFLTEVGYRKVNGKK